MIRSMSCVDHGRVAKALVLVAALAVLPGLGHAQQGEPTWLADDSTGCRVWNPFPTLGEAIRWDGPCENGYAQGRGTLRWFESGNLMETDQGEFRKGKLNGFATLVFTNGMRFEGNFEDHQPNGQGTLRTENGEVFSGQWSYGCFRDGERTRAFGTTPESCEFH